MSFFITKKSKHAMKERRKKKLLAEKGLLPPPSSSSSSNDDDDIHTNNSKNKRSRSEMTTDENDNEHVTAASKSVLNQSPTSPPPPAPQQQYNNLQSQQPIGSSRSTTHPTKKKQNQTITIVIPSNLTPKEIKKFRKDQRRQLRSDGTIRDDNDVLFILEGSSSSKNKNDTSSKTNEPIKKKAKLIFPCINDLVRQQQEQEEKEAKREATTQSTDPLAKMNGESDQEEGLDESYTSQYVALDCEMVGIGNQGRQSALARVSIVDWHHNVLLDTYVQVPMKVTDYRTAVSGIKPKHIQSHNNAMDVNLCRTTVANILQNKILVGHALKNDLHALMLTHPHTHIRDTAKYRPFQRLSMNNHTQKWRPRKLRDLVYEHCQQLKIQQAGESHNSIDDAIATMKLFQTVHKQWEYDIVQSSNKKK